MHATDTASPFSLHWDALRSPDLPLRQPPASQGERWLVGPDVDLFADGVSDAQRDRAYAAMALRPATTFLLLTGEPGRAVEYLARLGRQGRINDAAITQLGSQVWYRKRGAGWYSVDDRADEVDGPPFPLPNVLPGVRLATQADTDGLAWDLGKVPAARRWILMEPTEAIDLFELFWSPPCGMSMLPRGYRINNIHWVVIPDVSGLDPAAVRGVVKQCRAAGVPVWSGPAIDGELIRQGPEEVS